MFFAAKFMVLCLEPRKDAVGRFCQGHRFQGQLLCVQVECQGWLIGSITYICIVYTYIYIIYIHTRYTYTFLPSLRFLYGNHPSWEQPVNNRTTPHVRCWIWTSQRPQSKPRLKGDHTSVFRYPRWGAWWLLPPQDPNIQIIPKSHKYPFLGLPTWMVLISISSWSNCLMARLVQGVHPTYVCWFMNPSIKKILYVCM